MENDNKNIIDSVGFSQIFSGVGIGLLVGTLIGLSISPVVGTVLGGLIALLATFLGLTDQSLRSKDETPFKDVERGRRIREMRAGSFGLACILGVLLGLFIRTHNLLGVPIGQQVENWKWVGFTETEALQLVAYRELGIVPKNWSVVREGSTSRESSSVLFTSRQEICRDLALDKYINIAEVLNAWHLQGGSWKEIAARIKENVPPEFQASITKSAWRLACGNGE